MRFKDFLSEENKTNFYDDGKTKASRVVVLTSKPKSTDAMRTAERIKELEKKLKYKTYLVYAEEAYITIEKEIIRIHNIDDAKGFEIHPKNTLIMVRGSVGKYLSSLDLLSQLEKKRFFCVNTRECTEICSDKFRTTMRLIEFGLPTPKTAVFRSEDGLKRAFTHVGEKFPVILKTLNGAQGKGVFICESWKNMLSTLQTIWSLDENCEILIQEYIESEGDMRIHVLGEDILASMKRISGKQEFRANYSLGGSVKKTNDKELNEEVRDIAIQAAKVVKGAWVGVDVILDKKTKKPYLIEVNSSAGTEGIEKATGESVLENALNYLLLKENWKIPTVVCGYLEHIWVDGIGYVKSKFDTGNSVLCSLHAEDIKIDEEKKTVFWKHGDKEFNSTLIQIKEVKVGGLKEYKEKRPVILLDVLFNGERFPNIEFCLDDRSGRTADALIDRSFMQLAGLSINPARKYILSLAKPKEEKD